MVTLGTGSLRAGDPLTWPLFQVFSKLLYPIVRGAALSVLKYMLLTFQHSHEAFHLVRALPHSLASDLRWISAGCWGVGAVEANLWILARRLKAPEDM